MESFLLTTSPSCPLIGRNSLLSSLPFSSFTSTFSRKVEIRRSIEKITIKLPLSIVASASKVGNGRGSFANVVVDGSVASVAKDAVLDVSWKEVQYEAGSTGHRSPKPEVVDKEKQTKYITKILSSTVYDVAIETPLQLAPLLSSQLGINLWLKTEDSQQDMFNDERSILEPSGALSIAAAKAYCEYNNITGVNIVAVTSAANMNFDQLREISDLPNIDQSIVATLLPERPGSLQELTDLITSLKISITDMTYRFSQGSVDAVVVYKSDVKDEILFRLTFPEKLGALKHFLTGFQPNWNISLFHHRQQDIITQANKLP